AGGHPQHRDRQPDQVVYGLLLCHFDVLRWLRNVRRRQNRYKKQLNSPSNLLLFRPCRARIRPDLGPVGFGTLTAR
ncbi:MAG: hypothetical protein OXE80_02440, partial [Gammaproteobacteria bacterium]|nr:hypothetical protein [Gammaproteobacteria bacterium]